MGVFSMRLFTPADMSAECWPTDGSVFYETLHTCWHVGRVLADWWECFLWDSSHLLTCRASVGRLMGVFSMRLFTPANMSGECWPTDGSVFYETVHTCWHVGRVLADVYLCRQTKSFVAWISCNWRIVCLQTTLTFDQDLLWSRPPATSDPFNQPCSTTATTSTMSSIQLLWQQSYCHVFSVCNGSYYCLHFYLSYQRSYIHFSLYTVLQILGVLASEGWWEAWQPSPKITRRY